MGRYRCGADRSAAYGCNRATPSPTAPTTTAGSPALPAGGLLMMGTVSDTAFRPLGGAKVEVLDGPQTGLTTTANELGEFSLTGIFDDATRFRATKERSYHRNPAAWLLLRALQSQSMGQFLSGTAYLVHQHFR